MKSTHSAFLSALSSYNGYHPLKKRAPVVWNELYERGYALYEQGHYQQAVSLFESLLVDRPLELAVWEALASSRQMAKQFEKATYAWAMVAFIDRDNPLPHFYAAECYLSLYNKKDAHKALYEAKKRMDPSHLFWDRLHLLLQTV